MRIQESSHSSAPLGQTAVSGNSTLIFVFFLILIFCESFIYMAVHLYAFLCTDLHIARFNIPIYNYELIIRKLKLSD